MKTKVCGNCFKVKPADKDNFGPSKKHVDGLQLYCLECIGAHKDVSNHRIVKEKGKEQMVVIRPMTTSDKVKTHGFSSITAAVVAAAIYFILKYIGV